MIPIFGRKNKNQSCADEHSRHWLSGKNSSPNSHQHHPQNHINLKNNQQLPHQQHSHCTSSNLFNRPLAMNLENDMYYTVDFSDSQQSPLIQ